MPLTHPMVDFQPVSSPSQWDLPPLFSLGFHHFQSISVSLSIEGGFTPASPRPEFVSSALTPGACSTPFWRFCLLTPSLSYTTQTSIAGLHSSKNGSMLFLSSGKGSRRVQGAARQSLISFLHPPRANFKTHALLVSCIKLATSTMTESTAISASLSYYLSLLLCPNGRPVLLSKTASYFSCSLHTGM